MWLSCKELIFAFLFTVTCLNIDKHWTIVLLHKANWPSFSDDFKHLFWLGILRTWNASFTYQCNHDYLKGNVIIFRRVFKCWQHIVITLVPQNFPTGCNILEYSLLQNICMHHLLIPINLLAVSAYISTCMFSICKGKEITTIGFKHVLQFKLMWKPFFKHIYLICTGNSKKCDGMTIVHLIYNCPVFLSKIHHNTSRFHIEKSCSA